MKIDTEKIQVYPAKTRITLNDKATKILFNQTEENYEKLMNGSKRGVIEKKKHKKHGEIQSGYHLQNENGYTNIAPLGEYERAVLDVCISEFNEGNTCISLAMIQRGLTGKVGKDTNGIINKNQFAAIKQAVDKLMCTHYDPDILQAFDELDYEGAEEVTKDTLLPCKRIKKPINGKNANEPLVYFRDESPLFKIAKIKGQILTYPAELLDVPNQNNTPLVIALKNYSLRRVLECKQHSKQLKPILTLEDIFKKCRIANATKRKKQDARETLDKFFSHLQTKGVIKSFEWTKKANKFYSIKFTF